MPELTASRPFDQSLPLVIGECTVREIDLGPLTGIAPLKGAEQALNALMQDVHDLACPPPNGVTSSKEARLLWFGHDTYLLAGVAPDPGLGAHAALTDQSDAWAAVSLSGPATGDVLARLVPVDLRPAVFGQGAARRTLLGHMDAAVMRLGPDDVAILVFRSMAATLLGDLQEAMEAVAARG